MQPVAVPPTTDLVFEWLGADESSVDIVARVEEAVLGHRLDLDTRFLLGLRPAWAARRAGEVVGFAFGATPRADPAIDDGPVACGPIAALDPADLPPIIDHVVNEAAASDAGEFSISCPMSNRTSLLHLLGRGYRIDPFRSRCWRMTTRCASIAGSTRDPSSFSDHRAAGRLGIPRSQSRIR